MQRHTRAGQGCSGDPRQSDAGGGHVEVSNERLQQLHATTITDYAAYIPGLIVNSGGGPGQTTITLRGVAPVGPGSGVDDENDVSQQGARATLLWQINETLRCSSAACGNRSIPTTTPPHRSR